MSETKKIMNAEEMMQRIDQISLNLQSGSISLEESVIQYKEAIKLKKQLQSTLEEIEASIKVIDTEATELDKAAASKAILTYTELITADKKGGEELIESIKKALTKFMSNIDE